MLELNLMWQLLSMIDVKFPFEYIMNRRLAVLLIAALTLGAILFPAIITAASSGPVGTGNTFERTYGGSTIDYAYSVQQTSDGGYIVAGGTSSFSAGDNDIWLLKLNSAGTIQWQKTYGGPHYDVPTSVQQTKDGGYVVAGYTLSSVAAGYDGWVLKLRSDGSVQWQNTYGGPNGDFINSVQQTRDGGYIVAGRTLGANDDFWVLKLRSDGSVQWQKTYGGPYDDSALSVQQTSDGGYVVAGYTSSFGAGLNDAWVLKLRSDGSIQWQRAYGVYDDDYALSVKQSKDGGYIVAGYSHSFGAQWGAWILKLNSNGSVQWTKSYGGPGDDYAASVQQTKDNGYIVAGYTNSFGAGNYDFWVLKLNSAGIIQWQKTYGGPDDEKAYSVQQTGDGGYIVAGYTYSFGTGGNPDFWVLKLDSDGTISASCPLGVSSSATVNDVYSLVKTAATTATLTSTSATTTPTGVTGTAVTGVSLSVQC